MTSPSPFRADDPVSPSAICLEGLIVREAQHRLMNTLTILAGQLRKARTGAHRDTCSAIDLSVQAICAHGRLQAALMVELDGYVSVADYVEELCRMLSEAILEPLGIRCETVAEEGLLPAATVQTLGLVIHELAINAAKHAFDPPSPGIIRVEVLQHRRVWSCTVSDNGRGLSSTRNTGGSGTGLVRRLVEGAGGSMRVHNCSRGVSVAVQLPKNH